jgi:hypothetical protein
MATRLKLRPADPKPPAPLTDTARAYNVLASAYLEHTEGKASGLFDFNGIHGFSDRALWTRLDAMLIRM